MEKKVFFWKLMGALVALGFVSAPAMADTLTLTGTDGDSRTAQAIFEASGGNLFITLTNLGADVLIPTQLLTGVFFDISGTPALSGVSAIMGAGSQVLFAPDLPVSGTLSTAGSNVGGEFAFRGGLSGTPGGASYGISSAGLGLFGRYDRFLTDSNLQGPDAPDGEQYAITSAKDDQATGNTVVTGQFALIQNSVTFTLAGFDGSVSDISNVTFQYGTALTETQVAAVPEPATIFLLGGGLLVVGRLRRRFRKNE